MKNYTLEDNEKFKEIKGELENEGFITMDSVYNHQFDGYITGFYNGIEVSFNDDQPKRINAFLESII